MSYAGDVTPADAWKALSEDPAAVLVDVRTAAEWAYVGVPDLREIGKEVVRIEWLGYPGGAVNGTFLADLAATASDHDAPVYFLCRSGARSVAAAEAAAAAGWTSAHNVLDGFEGPPDGAKHRSVAGWKVAGLPWVQS
jgi:rhodanese-related sulfurtransferase